MKQYSIFAFATLLGNAYVQAQAGPNYPAHIIDMPVTLPAIRGVFFWF
jgi:hypothetical protein